MKAIGYIRVSTDEQVKEGISLEHQRAKIEAYCKLHEMELIGIEADKGISASTMKGRHGAWRVIEAVNLSKIDAVIVYKLDRFFRNAQEALSVASELNDSGVALHSVTERLDTQSAMGKFFFTIMAACAEMERNLISERTRDALRHKRAKGEVFNHAPYGYRIDDGKLVEDNAEQLRILIMNKKRMNGMTLKAIADELNAENVPTKSGGTWHPQTVRSILNRAPIGTEAKA